MEEVYARVFPTNKSFTFRNWANIYQVKPKYVHFPETESDIQQIIKYAVEHNEKVKVIGSGHSPSNIAITKDHMIVLSKYNKVLDIDHVNKTIKVQAGIRLFELNEILKNNNMSLMVLGSISEQTISGAVSTGTHGTGIDFYAVGSYIIEMEIVAAPNGEILKLTKGDERLKAFACSLGCLGVISTVTIQCCQAFALQAVQEPSYLEDILSNLNSFIKSADHWRFWWFPHTKNDKCITNSANRLPIENTKLFIGDSQKPKSIWQRIKSYFMETIVGFHGLQFALFLSKYMNWIVPSINSLWFNLLFSQKKQVLDLSYKVFNFDCLFKQYVNEWAIPIENTATALRELKKMIENEKLNVHFPIEVRFVKGDDNWLNPCFGRDSCYIGIIMYRPYDFTIPFQKYFDEYCEIMKKLGGRPHWAKEFTLDVKDLPTMYPMWNRFKQLREEMDPNNTFTNDYLKRLFL
ncbi:hypothetical protein ABK040_009883 [Willaertia magna]